MNRYFILLLMFATATIDSVAAQEPKTDDSHTIFGIVMEIKSGAMDVPVCLCDGKTGLPVARETYEPVEWGKERPDETAKKLAITVTDKKGKFRFENVPNGAYRVVAQRWTGPYRGLFEEHGTVIQLMGVADDIKVPRPEGYYDALVGLRPPGKRIVQFDQQVGNSDTILFLSTQPPEYDPVLGLTALGDPFFKNLVGLNRMPLGRTTVIGAPDQPLHAFFFAPDNSPGFAAVTIPVSKVGLVRVPTEPFIAGWSDGRKTPPPRLAELMKHLAQHSLTCDQLLNIPELSAKNYLRYKKRMQELQADLDKTIDLPKNRSARVADLMAIMGYQRLAKL